jgi:hypothetical protein
MLRSVGRLRIMLGFVVGVGWGCSASEARPASVESVAAQKATASKAEQGTLSASPPSGPVLTLALHPEVGAEGVGLRVINAGSETLSLAREIRVQQKRGAAWVELATPGLFLELTCGSTGCVSLAPGAELDAPSWLGRITNERCGAPFRPEQPGVYRLRVTSCEGSRSTEVELSWPGV